MQFDYRLNSNRFCNHRKTIIDSSYKQSSTFWGSSIIVHHFSVERTSKRHEQEKKKRRREWNRVRASRKGSLWMRSGCTNNRSPSFSLSWQFRDAFLFLFSFFLATSPPWPAVRNSVPNFYSKRMTGKCRYYEEFPKQNFLPKDVKRLFLSTWIQQKVEMMVILAHNIDTGCCWLKLGYWDWIHIKRLWWLHKDLFKTYAWSPAALETWIISEDCRIWETPNHININGFAVLKLW